LSAASVRATTTLPNVRTRNHLLDWMVSRLFFTANYLHCMIETPPLDDVPAATDGVSTAAGSGSGKYIPPSMRAGAGGRGESMFRGAREEQPTLRVTNVSEDTTEADLRDLFGAFGRVARVYVGRDRETGAGKGYAFVSFEDRAVAQRAMDKVHGMGYDNLILNCQWSQPRDQR
jgi:translation initiation factor 3 subunit G